MKSLPKDECCTAQWRSHCPCRWKLLTGGCLLRFISWCSDDDSLEVHGVQVLHFTGFSFSETEYFFNAWGVFDWVYYEEIFCRIRKYSRGLNGCLTHSSAMDSFWLWKSTCVQNTCICYKMRMRVSNENFKFKYYTYSSFLHQNWDVKILRWAILYSRHDCTYTDMKCLYMRFPK